MHVFEANSPKLRRFQTAFLRAATAPGVDTACLSLPRGNGKSWLAGHLITRAMTPGDKLFADGKEVVLLAASLEQARICFRFAREVLEPRGGYKLSDSATRIGIVHRESNTRLRVISSNAKSAMGLVSVPLVIADEPGAWESVKGGLMYDALSTASGKPGSPMRQIYIGTLAPARSGWWHDLIASGSTRTRHVTCLQGDLDRWDQWPEIRRCNPLTAVDGNFRRKLLEERDEGRRDSRLKARFLSYRMNRPSADESDVLLTVDDWKRVVAREVPPRQGRPTVGLDLGGGRAWSAAVAVWPNGRTEAIALAPGKPDIASQERRDLVPRGAYQRLVDAGVLRTAGDLLVPPPSMLTAWIMEAWGTPQVAVSDLFRLNELRDAKMPCELATRRMRWSESSEDIRATRKLAKDAGMSCTPESAMLILESLSHALVQNDSSGSFRLVKRDPSNNSGRDDVASALVLAAGTASRRKTERRVPLLRLVG